MEIEPKYSKNRVRTAGERLCELGQVNSDELDVVDYWRAAHQHPLDQMSEVLKRFIRKGDGSFLACRLKRIDSIKGKLARESHTYKLNSMYDIAGCRFVARDLERVYQVVDDLSHLDTYRSSKDYIAHPKPSGYRCVHLIHCFDSPEYGYQGLRVETQIRTNLQHMWATAVEVYDVVTQASLKFGAGSRDEEYFFALVSQLFANEEGTSCVPGVPCSPQEVLKELVRLNEQLRVTSKLRAYSESVSVVNEVAQQVHADYVLLTIDFDVQQIRLETFSPGKEKEAIAAYGRFERTKRKSEDAVLIKASSMEDIQRAYPNYYSDISSFIDKLQECLP